MKTLLKIVVGLFAVGGIAIAAVLYFTTGLTRVADDFFDAVRAGDMPRAYEYLSADFRATVTRGQLHEWLSRNALVAVQEASWPTRTVSGGRGELVGSVTTADGGPVPLTMSFVKGENGWKIHAINKPAAGVSQTGAGGLPSESEQRQLVAGAIATFAASVNEGSMARFHDHISQLWREQWSVAELDQAYAGFFDLGADLGGLVDATPVFDQQAAIDEQGLLILKGRYTDGPMLAFEQKYIQEGAAWKLVGFNVSIQ
jgi:hypothetical protein